MPRLLFLTASSFYPDVSGGAEKSNLFLFRHLQKKGWDIEVVCAHKSFCAERRIPKIFRKIKNKFFLIVLKMVKNTMVTLWQKVSAANFKKDDLLGFACWRGNTRGERVRRFILRRIKKTKPDIVLNSLQDEVNMEVFDSLLNKVAEMGLRVLRSVRIVECLSKKRFNNSNKQIIFIANSPFSEAILSSITHNKIVCILPFIERDDYVSEKKDPKYVTFINPVEAKGGSVAIEIARRMPETRFLFVKGKWSEGHSGEKNEYFKKIYSLSNVRLLEHQEDMKIVYAQTKILLCPSQFEESFGRVIVEAQFNGIPVVASDAGGISYVLGDGGTIVSPRDNIEGYVHALKRLIQDPSYYERISEKAFMNSNRPEFDANFQFQKFLKLIQPLNT